MSAGYDVYNDRIPVCSKETIFVCQVHTVSILSSLRLVRTMQSLPPANGAWGK